MRIFTLAAAAVCTLSMMAQSSSYQVVRCEREANGSYKELATYNNNETCNVDYLASWTSKGAKISYKWESELYLKALKDVTVNIKFKALSGDWQCCAGTNCLPCSEGQTIEPGNLKLTAGEYSDLQIHTSLTMDTPNRPTAPLTAELYVTSSAGNYTVKVSADPKGDEESLDFKVTGYALKKGVINTKAQTWYSNNSGMTLNYIADNDPYDTGYVDFNWDFPTLTVTALNDINFTDVTFAADSIEWMLAVGEAEENVQGGKTHSFGAANLKAGETLTLDASTQYVTQRDANGDVVKPVTPVNSLGDARPVATGKYILTTAKNVYTFNYTAANTGDLSKTGIADVADNAQAPTVYFDLMGRQVENPQNGLFIMKQGNKAVKVIK